MPKIKTAIVTGASSGIGRTTAIALSAAGWNVVLTARSLENLQETYKLCPAQERCFIVAGDVTNEEFVEDLFRQTLAHFGFLDLLFNNAGTGSPQVPIEEVSLETFQRVMNVNLTGPFLCTREAFKVFKRQHPPGGRIINNGSVSSRVPRPFSFPYTCSKNAITGLTKCTALDGRQYSITCTQIDIGNAHTEMGGRHSLGSLQPNGQFLPEATFEPQHVSSTIVHIANLPNDVTVLDMNIMATEAPFVGRG